VHSHYRQILGKDKTFMYKGKEYNTNWKEGGSE